MQTKKFTPVFNITVRNVSDYTKKDWDYLRETIVNKLYNEMFEIRITPKSLSDWNEKSFFGGANKDKYKDLIRNLIATGHHVKTGYRCSTMIRNSHEHFVLWKQISAIKKATE